MSIKDDCKCGHDRTCHFRHPDGTWCNCLAMHCDCKYFRDPNKAFNPKPDWLQKQEFRELRAKYLADEDTGDPPETPRMYKPHSDTACTCGACQAWLAKRWPAVWP